MVKVAVMGYGVVGSGVVEVFYKNHKSICKNAGLDMEIGYILDLRDFEGDKYAHLITHDFNDILNDDDVKIVVETMGGVKPAFDFVSKCLMAGKSVATSNKELVATRGAELIKTAKDYGVNFLFEASVGGGIPIIRPLTQCLAANEFTEIFGILNGTTNYILTQMIENSVDFSSALEQAQKLGYAEKDPTADIEGHDACRKICILTALAFGKHVYPNQVYTQGITKITLEDVAFCKKFGRVIKLIARTKKTAEGKVFATVYPSAIPEKCQLGSVDDVYNAVMVKGNAVGDVEFYGKGAGKLPTASAVVGDIIDCAKHLHSRKYLFWKDGDENYIESYKNDTVKFYVRTIAEQNALIKAFGHVEIFSHDEKTNQTAFITNPMKESEFDEIVEKGDIKLLSMIRVLDI